jgi:CRISPR-associated protein Csb2
VFAIEVEYLLGRAFAGDFNDRARSEWPPHPGRLFSALSAAYFENGTDLREKSALEWLEGQKPPHIHAGEAGEGETPTAFVPTNYPGDGPPVIRRKQPRFFPAQGPSEAVVHFVWRDAEPDPGITEALDRLASRTGYLGKACSVVRMRVTDTAPEPNYAPESGGDQVLRVPSKGRLQELGWLFEADQRVSPGAQQRYQRTDINGGASEGEPLRTEFEQMAVFRKKAGPGLPIEAALTLTDAVRRALMSNAGSGGPMTDLIHGHNEDTHCAVVGLPFVGRQYADGHLMGFAVIFPRATGATERVEVLRACKALEERGVNIPNVGDWEVEIEEEAAVNQALRAATWTRPSRVWQTVTPILLDRFPKKKGPGVEEILAASCRRIGLPDPVGIEHGPYSAVDGVPPVPAFRLQRAGEQRARWGVHTRFEFATKVRGPMVLGAGRYFGLGFMRPETEKKPDGRN